MAWLAMAITALALDGRAIASATLK